MTGRTGTRALSGIPESAPDQAPAAITTRASGDALAAGQAHAAHAVVADARSPRPRRPFGSPRLRSRSRSRAPRRARAARRRDRRARPAPGARWAPGRARARRAAVGSSRSARRPQSCAKGQLAVERLGLVTVARHQQRAARAQPGSRRRPGPRPERGPARGAASLSASRPRSPNARLGHGREHARGDPGASRRPAGRGRARAGAGRAGARASDGEAGDAAADDGDVGGARWSGHVTSLRRHDPDQVLTVGGRSAALSARRGLP